MATQHSHPAKLTEAQRTIVVAATQRSDMSIILPARLKGEAARKLAQALLDKGLAREIRARGEQPVWRKDERTGHAFTLVLTKAGRALGAEPAAGDQQQAVGVLPDSDAAASKSATPTGPRPGSKLAGVISLLGRAQGTSVSEMMAATGWLPHTTRAALTGLRKRGYALTREVADGGPVYRISAAPAAPA